MMSANKKSNQRMFYSGSLRGLSVFNILFALLVSSHVFADTSSSKATAQIQQLEGNVLLQAQTAPQKIQLKQVLNDGDMLELAKDSLVKINYNNSCSEEVSGTVSHSISACGCQTSPFRVGKIDDFNATLTKVEGDVLIYQGVKYVPAKEGMRIRNGDRIMSMSKASTTMTFDHGCVVSTDSLSIYDVDGCDDNACPVSQTFQQQPTQPQPTQTAQAQPASTAPAPTAPAPAAPAPVAPAPVAPAPVAPAPVAGAGGTVTPTGGGLLSNPGIIASGAIVGVLAVGDEIELLKTLLDELGIKIIADDDDDEKRAVSP